MIDLTENTPESTKHALPLGKYEKRSIRWNTTSLLYLGNLTREKAKRKTAGLKINEPKQTLENQQNQNFSITPIEIKCAFPNCGLIDSNHVFVAQTWSWLDGKMHDVILCERHRDVTDLKTYKYLSRYGEVVSLRKDPITIDKCNTDASNKGIKRYSEMSIDSANPRKKIMVDTKTCDEISNESVEEMITENPSSSGGSKREKSQYWRSIFKNVIKKPNRQRGRARKQKQPLSTLGVSNSYLSDNGPPELPTPESSTSSIEATSKDLPQNASDVSSIIQSSTLPSQTSNVLLEHKELKVMVDQLQSRLKVLEEKRLEKVPTSGKEDGRQCQDMMMHSSHIKNEGEKRNCCIPGCKSDEIESIKVGEGPNLENIFVCSQHRDCFKTIPDIDLKASSNDKAQQAEIPVLRIQPTFLSSKDADEFDARGHKLVLRKCVLRPQGRGRRSHIMEEWSDGSINFTPAPKGLPLGNCTKEQIAFYNVKRIQVGTSSVPRAQPAETNQLDQSSPKPSASSPQTAVTHDPSTTQSEHPVANPAQTQGSSSSTPGTISSSVKQFLHTHNQSNKYVILKGADGKNYTATIGPSKPLQTITTLRNKPQVIAPQPKTGMSPNLQQKIVYSNVMKWRGLQQTKISVVEVNGQNHIVSRIKPNIVLQTPQQPSIAHTQKVTPAASSEQQTKK